MPRPALLLLALLAAGCGAKDTTPTRPLSDADRTRLDMLTEKPDAPPTPDPPKGTP